MNTNFTFSFLALIYILLSYLVGSIPTGVWYSIAKHKMDVRTMGSGNSGGTNVGRNFGLKAAVIVTGIDVLKGWLPVFLAKLFFPEQPLAVMLSAIACVIGHAYPVFAGFRGGKIVATSIGVLLAYNFPLALFQVVALFALLYITSIMSFSALVSYGAASLFILISAPEWEFKLGFLLIYALMAYRHRDNIRSLMNGQERMLDWGMKLNLPFDTSKLEQSQFKLPKMKNNPLKKDQIDKVFVHDKFNQEMPQERVNSMDEFNNNFDDYQDNRYYKKNDYSRQTSSIDDDWSIRSRKDSSNASYRYDSDINGNGEFESEFDKYSDYEGPAFGNRNPSPRSERPNYDSEYDHSDDEDYNR